MARSKQKAEGGRRKAIAGPWGCLFLGASCLLAAAGCASDGQIVNDPLFGGQPAPRPSAPPAGSPQRQTAVPPLAAPHSSPSTAALAPGGLQPLDSRPELRATGRGGAPAWKGTPTGVALQPPEPVGDAVPASGFTLTGGVRLLTFEQAQALLSARGVTWQRLDAGPEPGEWKFSCSIPNRQNPHIRRFYEARAGDPISAIRAVIEQIDKER